VTTQRSWPVRRRFSIRFQDIDVLNHLNHAAYFPMMETLRCDYYLPILGIDDPSRIDIIVVEATCRYLVPVGYGAELEGEVAPGRPLGRTSFTLLYRFTDVRTGTVTARGRTVIVTYDYARSTKKPIPDSVRQRLEADTVDPVHEGWA
jgi:acyl-CoA thioester hydrolase